MLKHGGVSISLGEGGEPPSNHFAGGNYWDLVGMGGFFEKFGPVGRGLELGFSRFAKGHLQGVGTEGEKMFMQRHDVALFVTVMNRKDDRSIRKDLHHRDPGGDKKYWK